MSSILLNEMFDSFEDDRTHPTVTDLIYCLTAKYWNTTNQRFDNTDRSKMYMLLGLGLEKALLSQRQVATSRAYTLDGIQCHVDSLDDGLLELKTTRMGPNRFPDDIPGMWLKQMMAYCKVNEVTTCSMVVLHIIQGELVAWELEFDPEEIEDNWKWILERKEIWDHYAELGEAPASFVYNEPWECKDCVYKLVCDSRAYIKLLGEKV